MNNSFFQAAFARFSMLIGSLSRLSARCAIKSASYYC
jgi:hypothetical protein